MSTELLFSIGLGGGFVVVGIAFWLGQMHERREARFKQLLMDAHEYHEETREGRAARERLRQPGRVR